MVLHICAICGIEFEAKRNDKTCSPAHSIMLNRESARKWRAENLEKVRASQRERTQRYHSKNLERINAAKRKRRAENLESERERNRKWRVENAEKVRAAHRKYRAENHERELEKERKYRVENAEMLRARLQHWQIENPEKIKAARRKWVLENPEKVRANIRRQHRKRANRKALAEFQFQATTLAEGTIPNEHSRNRTAGNAEHVQTAVNQGTLHAPRYLRKSRRNSAHRRKQAFSRA